MNAHTVAYHTRTIMQRASVLDLRRALDAAQRNNQDASAVRAELYERYRQQLA